MKLAAKIVHHLRATVFPLSLAELGRALPDSQALEIEHACKDLERQSKLGRHGADTPSSPYRFYLTPGTA